MNRADILMLNQAMQNLGQSGLQNRQLQQVADERELDRQMRERIFQDQAAARQQQYQADQEHWRKVEQAQQDAATARQQQLQNAQNAQDLQDKQRMLQSLIGLNAGGQLQDLDAVNDWLAKDPHFGATGIQLQEPTQKAPAQIGQNAAAAALQHADEWRQKAAALPDGDPNKARFVKYADMLEQSVDPSSYQNVTTETLDPNTGKVTGRTMRKVPAGSNDPEAANFQKFLQNRTGAAAATPRPAPAPFAAPSTPALQGTGLQMPDWAQGPAPEPLQQ